MLWWMWIFVGLVLLIAEALIATDFYLFFLGLAALLVGTLVSFFDLLMTPLEPWMQWASFAVFTIVLMCFLRKKVLNKLHTSAEEMPEDLIGDNIKITEDIPVGEIGQAETRGTVWSVKNESKEVLQKGSVHSVSAKDGILLIVR
ncbi:MAG: NfeD family protein [Bdellovibrionota bacterium]|jgi:membrane protein implicated in regulation of membrane protease activity